MTYECLIQTEDCAFVVARPQGHPWTERERTAPWFEIVTVDAEPRNFDREIPIAASFGPLTVPASEIDPALVVDAEGGEV